MINSRQNIGVYMLIRMAIMAVIILTGCDRSQPADASNSEQKIGDSVALNSEALRQTKLSNTVFDFDFSNLQTSP